MVSLDTKKGELTVVQRVVGIECVCMFGCSLFNSVLIFTLIGPKKYI